MAGDIEIFKEAYNSGLIMTKFNLCCPDCNGSYSLTNYQDFEQFMQVYANAQSNGNDVGELCCLSLFVGTDAWLKFVDGYGDQFPDLSHIITTYGEAYTQCGATSDFMFYINQLSLLLGESSPGIDFIKKYVEDWGIIEINTFNGHSGLKFIYEFLSSTGLSQIEMQELFVFIMGNPKIPEFDRGLLIRCIFDDILISRTRSYYGFLENYFGSNLYLCLKTMRDRDGQVNIYTYTNVLPESNLVNGQPFYVIAYNESGVTGNYYIFWSSVNNRWEVWSGFNTTTNTGTGIFHSSLNNASLDIFLVPATWDDQTTVDKGLILDSSLKVECDDQCNFKSNNL